MPEGQANRARPVTRGIPPIGKSAKARQIRINCTWNVLLPPWVQWRPVVEEFLAAVNAMRVAGDIEPMWTSVTETLGELWDLDRWLVTRDDVASPRRHAGYSTCC